MTRALIALSLAVLMLAACGRKGDPHPPRPPAPESTAEDATGTAD